MSSRKVNWEEIKKKVASFSFGVSMHPFEKCSLGSQIGSGAAMEVYEGQCQTGTGPKKVAFKQHLKFKDSRLSQHEVDGILEQFRHEIKLMKRLDNHPNVVQIIGVTFIDEGKPILIVELGNEKLDRYLRDKADEYTPVNWAEKVKLCLDVLSGIYGLHNAGIIHGDIKGENVLIFIEDSGITAKISDFGYSSTLTSSKGYVGGTLRFMAPEATRKYPELVDWEKRQEQDIYGFGLVTYQIVTNGAIPYADVLDHWEILDAKDSDRDLTNLLANLPHDTPDQLRTVIIKTTKFMPIDRASIKSVRQILSSFLSVSPLQQSVDNIEDVISRKQTPSDILSAPSSKTILETITPPITGERRIKSAERLMNYAKTNGFNSKSFKMNGIAKRLAVVIGNSEYENFTTLTNATNDAVTVKETLHALGYEVSGGNNLQRNEMLNSFNNVLDSWKHIASEIVFYYSGYGISIDGMVYIAPVNADGGLSKNRIRESFLSVEIIFRLLHEHRKDDSIPIILILNCYRSKTTSDSTRGYKKEDQFQDLGTKINIAILYSTDDQDAIDGGDHGLYIKILLENIMKDLTIYEINSVITRTLRESSRLGAKQVSWLYECLYEPYRFSLPKLAINP